MERITASQELGRIVVNKKSASPLFEFLSENALKTVLGEPDTSTPKGIRDMFYMIMLYDSGARNRELLNLRLGSKLFSFSRWPYESTFYRS